MTGQAPVTGHDRSGIRDRIAEKKTAITAHYGEVCELKGYPGSSKDTPRIDFFRSILIRNQLE